MPTTTSPKISVIIPVYGVEDYIEKCLQSLLDQTFTDFEAIIVDDGSPDQSIPIAKELVGNDSRFIFLEKENGGLSSARNYGLKYISGNYILFLDSDDYYSPNTLEICTQYLKNHPNVDIALFGITLVSNSKKIQKSLPDLDRYYSDKDILLAERTISYSACDKIFKSNLFKKKQFMEGILYEDKELMPSLLFKKNISVIPHHLYFYTKRDGSIMHSYSQLSLKSFLEIYKNYKLFLQENDIYNKFFHYYEKAYINYCFYTELIQITKFSKQYKNDIKSLSKNLDKKIVNFKKISSYYHPLTKQYISYILYKISPIIFRVVIKTALKIRSIIR